VANLELLKDRPGSMFRRYERPITQHHCDRGFGDRVTRRLPRGALGSICWPQGGGGGRRAHANVAGRRMSAWVRVARLISRKKFLFQEWNCG
jgi:hypothetical protein